MISYEYSEFPYDGNVFWHGDFLGECWDLKCSEKGHGADWLGVVQIFDVRSRK